MKSCQVSHWIVLETFIGIIALLFVFQLTKRLIDGRMDGSRDGATDRTFFLKVALIFVWMEFVKSKHSNKSTDVKIGTRSVLGMWFSHVRRKAFFLTAFLNEWRHFSSHHNDVIVLCNSYRVVSLNASLYLFHVKRRLRDNNFQPSSAGAYVLLTKLWRRDFNLWQKVYVHDCRRINTSQRKSKINYSWSFSKNVE